MQCRIFCGGNIPPCFLQDAVQIGKRRTVLYCGQPAGSDDIVHLSLRLGKNFRMQDHCQDEALQGALCLQRRQ